MRKTNKAKTKVYVQRVNGRPFAFRWIDPETGQVRQKSAETLDYAEAVERAAEFAESLANPVSESVTWDEFRDRFDTEKLAALSEGTQETYGVTFNRLEELVGPATLDEVTSSTLSRFAAALRKDGAREVTIAKHMRQMRAAMQWAKDVELVEKVPTYKMPRGHAGKKMKGRPLTEVEIAAMLAAVESVVGPDAAPSWRFYLQGLFFQGLRLAEGLNLYWDRDDRHRVDFSGRFPMIRICGEFEKGKRNRILPMAPAFAELLRQIPDANRSGQVFPLQGLDHVGIRWLRSRVSHIGSEIGKKAGIVVATDPKSGKQKYASLHDLRRSCALAWSRELSPQQLMEFMRHSSIQVTLDYYVGDTEERTAAAMWDSYRQRNTRH